MYGACPPNLRVIVAFLVKNYRLIVKDGVLVIYCYITNCIKTQRLKTVIYFAHSLVDQEFKKNLPGWFVSQPCGTSRFGDWKVHFQMASLVPWGPQFPYPQTGGPFSRTSLQGYGFSGWTHLLHGGWLLRVFGWLKQSQDPPRFKRVGKWTVPLDGGVARSQKSKKDGHDFVAIFRKYSLPQSYLYSFPSLHIIIVLNYLCLSAI